MSQDRILVSWISFNNDPYEREKTGAYRLREGAKIPGPSLELLANPRSPYAGEISRAYYFVRRGTTGVSKERLVDTTESEVFARLAETLADLLPGLPIESRSCEKTSSPTAHKELYFFVAEELAKLRRQHPRATLVINLSPGTCAMQTVLLLALQARFAGEPVEVVQGIPADHRRDPSVILEGVPWNLLGELNLARTAHAASVAHWSLPEARSPALRHVTSLVDRFGSVPFPVLLLGSRGSGKSRVAQLLRAGHHEHRMRGVPGADGDWPFWINCAALPEALIESELFGHEAESFTGAGKRRIGILEQASKTEDCVFLDEVHHLSHAGQARLLVALDRGGGFRRVGGSEMIKSRFRLIAASNRSREELRRVLYADFYDRIADFVIEQPALRDCPEDLPAIWDQVAWDTCAEIANGGARRARGAVLCGDLFSDLKPIRDDVLAGLRKMRLPGNWRDIQRFARRLIASGLASNELITLVVTPEQVQVELERLQREERAETGSDPNEPGLPGELPSLGRCAEAIQMAHTEGRPLVFNTLMEAWEERLLGGALRVGKSGKRAAPLLSMPDRTFNERVKKHRLGK